MRSYIIPTLQALLVHVLVIGAFTVNWESDSEKELPPPPQVVQAKVLTMADPIAARRVEEAKKKAEAKRRAAEKRKREEAKRKAAERKKAEAKRKAEARKKADAKRKADELKKAEAKKLAEQKKLAEEQRREAEAERLRQEQLALDAQRREEELAQALADEMAAAQEEDDRIAAQSYESLIRQRIMENWHIPLSARKGMVAKVAVYFLPTGEINTVSLQQSSGDDAFDRSAVLAVERVGKVEELQQLEPRVFDKFFRKRVIKFNPEDLERW